MKRAGVDGYRSGQTRGPGWLRVLAPALVVAAALLAYSNSFSGAFVYDDIDAIRDNVHIRTLWPPAEALSVPLWNSGTTVDRRPLLSLSLAVNRKLLGPDPWGFHAGNVLIHILNALLLFGIARRTAAGLAARGEAAGGVSARGALAPGAFGLAVALLWVVHPLQTGAVTYLSQRAESLAALLYLAALYAFVRALGAGAQGGARGGQGAGDLAAAATGSRPERLWQGVAVAACVLGMTAKETMASLPVVILLYDVVFGAGSLREAWRRRRWFYAGLAATWAILAAILVAGGEMAVQDLRQTSPWRYLLTQAGVILHYLRLCAWPSPLVLDYGWPLVRSVGEAVLPGLAVLALLGATLAGLWRRRWQGFAGAWAFLILAPSSSLYPCEQAAFEHRVYLPLAAVLALAVSWAAAGLRRIASPRATGLAGVALLAALCAAGIAGSRARNVDYRSEISIWQQNIRNRPGSWVASYNLGCAQRRLGDLDAAEASFRRAIGIKPDYPDAQNNLGVVLALRGRNEEAVAHYRLAIAANPRYSLAYNNLGSALDKLGDPEGALEQFRQAVSVSPRHESAHVNWGNVLMKLGRADEAIEHYRLATSINPGSALAHYNLANALARRGEVEAAIGHFEEAIRADPSNGRFHLNLATALELAGRADEAAAHLSRALDLDPRLHTEL